MNAPKIVTLEAKRIVGMKSQMLRHQFENIVGLWKQFMPRRHEISNAVGNEFIALQDYKHPSNPNLPFDIWAAIEVSNEALIPEQMQSFVIPEGLYAVFLHKGMDAAKTYQYITQDWLPTSGYAIDHRPHFQVMGEKYKNGSPDSEEDFYVPIVKP